MKKVKEWKEIPCEVCQKLFSKLLHPDPARNSKHHYCSVECARRGFSLNYRWTDELKVRYSKQQSGEHNPNFGKKWTDEQKQDASKKRIQQFKDNPDYALACGKSNRGVKFNQDRIDRMYANRTAESFVRGPHTEETKKRIGEKSRLKWTEEFKKQDRARREAIGQWVPTHLQNPYRVYYKAANWIDETIQFLSTEDRAILKEKGLWSATNPNGVVRDHILDRRAGWDLDVPAYIIQHPANLQILEHADNVRKGFTDRKLSRDEQKKKLSILLKKIQDIQYNQYTHQTECLNFIFFEYEQTDLQTV